MNFQKLILTIATILLIIILVIIGLSLSKTINGSTTVWPPLTSDCPDYWLDASGNGSSCLNTHSLGKCNIPSKGNPNTMNFNQMPFTGSDGLCAKYRWATNCGVTWDGITFGVQNPCTTSST